MSEPKLRELKLDEKVLSALPPSIRRGIRELTNQFSIMEHSLLSGHEFIKQIHGSIETFFLVLKEAYCDEKANSTILLSQLDSIEEGIAFLRGAITNRLEAGRYLYEPVLFNPHNMGPFSKLYSFYERFVDLFERLISKYNNLKNDAGGEARVSFIIDISIHSSVHAQPFVPLTCRNIPNNILVGITVNEHQFFQIDATIVLLLHEIGHYVRPIERKTRNITLRDIVFQLLGEMICVELKGYLYPDLMSPTTEFNSPAEEEKRNAILKHFEEDVFPMIKPIIYYALEDYCDNFTKSEQIIKDYGENPYASLLRQFQLILEEYFKDLSRHLTALLFSSKAATVVLEEQPQRPVEKPIESSLRAYILGLLPEQINGPDKTHQKTDNPVSFKKLSSKATYLFEPGQRFEPSSVAQNEQPDRMMNSYLKSLALLGLNEDSKNNQQHFTDVVLHCMKKAIEEMQHESFLEMIFHNLDEALAHLFWIRTLNVRDFDTYWAVMEPLIEQTAFGEDEKIKDFGPPNAIITEYFNLMEKTLQEYKISPFNASGPWPRSHMMRSLKSKEKLNEDFQQIVFIPMAEYLMEENEIFPEEQLFQLYSNMPTTEDRELIERLREGFKKFLQNNEPDSRFLREMQMIEFFSNTSSEEM